jgi:hypothetical protein
MRALALAAAALVVAAAARPAAAQAAAAPDVRRADVAAAAPTRLVAEYRIRAGEPRFPTHVTLVDSAGELVASYRRNGVAAPQPMAVRAVGDDLVLETQTASGPLTMVLYGANGGDRRVLAGRWNLGEHAGALRGRVQH